MAGYNAMTAEFEEVTIFGKPALFTSCRIERDTVPDGLHLYEVRHDDDCNGDAVQLGRNVVVNHWGSLITRDEMQLAPDGFLDIEPDDLNYGTGDCRSVEDFMERTKSACPLGGDSDNDCADCVYSGEYGFRNGECMRREAYVKLPQETLDAFENTDCGGMGCDDCPYADIDDDGDVDECKWQLHLNVRAALEKQLPKAVRVQSETDKSDGIQANCPCCGTRLCCDKGQGSNETDRASYCPHCGQALDWRVRNA